jgi:putative ABC transport system permease protein
MSAPAYRAVARVALGGGGRARWRSLRVVAMVALPIGGLVTAAIAIRTATETPAERALAAMGSADLLVYPSKGVDVADIQDALAAGTTVAEQRSAYTETAIGGTFTQIFLTEVSIPVDRPPGRGLLALVNGRFPSASGEGAVSPRLLDSLQADIGGTATLEEIGFAFRVTGTAVQRREPTFPVAILGPGSFDALEATRPNVVDTEAFLVDLPSGTSIEQAVTALKRVPGLEGGIDTRASMIQLTEENPNRATGWSFAVTVLVLLGTGLIAGAAFAVGARRQLRTLGLLGAAGGEPGHIRATVLTGGVTLGFLGSLAGVALGIACAFAIHPHLNAFAGQLVGPVEIPIQPLVGAVALGTMAGALAALGPARTAGRLTTLQALAGRLPTPRRPGRIAATGMTAVAVGCAIVILATPSHSGTGLVTGVIIMTAGFLIAIPLLVTWTGRIAGALPPIPRLSTRDIARHSRRTGTALAAAVIALAVPVAVSAITLSQEAADRRVPYLADDQLMIELVGRGADWDPAVETELRRALPGSALAPLIPLVATEERREQSVERVLTVHGPEHTDANGSWWIGGQLLVDDGELLRVLHAEDGLPALEAGKVVGLGPDSIDLEPGVADDATVKVYVGARERRSMTFPASEAGSATYNATSGIYMISQARAHELGFSASASSIGYPQMVLRAAAPLDEEQIDRAKDVAARHSGTSVRAAGDYSSGEGGARLLVSVIASMLALAIVFVIVALVGAESRRDQAILVAVGGEPRIRRAVAGSRALVTALLAGFLAAPVGFLPAAVFRIAQARGYPIVVPWTTLGIVLLATPILAGLSAALVSRQPKAAQLLRPIE